jgi:hypothetical protein
MHRAELNISKLGRTAVRSIVASLALLGSTSAFAVDCYFPPSMEGEWQSSCSLFKTDPLKLTFTRYSPFDQAIVSQGTESCRMDEHFDKESASGSAFTYSVTNIENCTSLAARRLLATYTFANSETELIVERDGASKRLVDCKRYPPVPSIEGNLADASR